MDFVKVKQLELRMPTTIPRKYRQFQDTAKNLDTNT
jgi:hypothetical protein